MVISALRLTKKERQSYLTQAFEQNPFLTDEEMAKSCRVSIQTIRLDRLELGIPELRERIKHMAEKKFDDVQSLSPNEVIGDVINLQLHKSGISLLEIRSEHVFERNQIARGHILFAQANSLAIALAEWRVALTGNASIRFVRPVRLGEKCIAFANVTQAHSNRLHIEVQTKIQEEVVFHGVFEVYRVSDDDGI